MIRAVAASIMSGVMVALAFPTTNMWILAWMGLIPLFRAIELSPSPWAAAICGLGFGFSFFGVDLRWTYDTVRLHGDVGPLIAVFTSVGLVALMSLFTGLFGLIMGLFGKNARLWPGMIPFIWVSCEFARANLLTGFPWDLLGYSQADRSMITQISDITGVYGVSFLIVLVNVSIMACFRIISSQNRAQIRLVLLTILLMGAALLYGNARLSEHRGFDSKDKAWTVGVLQGSIPQKYKWLASERHRTVRAYTELGEVSVRKGADALIWPETSLPTLFMGEDPFWKTPSLISADLGKPILFGAPYEIGGPGSGIFVNSAFLIDGFHILGRYDKIHLVPFGEYMPFNRLLPLGPGLATRSADYSPGEEMRVMSLPGSPPFSVLICYEIIFPDLSRQAINKGAKLLINITNDGWFGDSAAPYQHLAMARFRAVENRAWLIRCANTGVSVAVDPTGKIRERIPLNEKGYFNFQFPSDLEAGAFYTRFSDLFAWVCIIAVILWAVMMRRAVCRPLSHSDFQNP